MIPGVVISSDIVIFTGEKKNRSKAVLLRGAVIHFKIVGFWLISDLIHIDVKLCLPV